MHLLTTQRWDVVEFRRHSDRCGFGRVHAKEIPPEKAVYVAKYVAKDLGAETVRCRLWGAIGFESVVSSNISCKIDVDRTCLSGSPSGLAEFLVWQCETHGAITLRLRPDPPEGVEPITRMIELKKNQEKEVLAAALQSPVCVGEYRGHALREITFTDKKSGQRVTRLTVEHNIEVAGLAKLVVQWLPVGSTQNDVKIPAGRGDVVLLVVKSSKSFGGQTTYEGEIKPLTQLV